jgi:hypothetical protein
MSNQEKTKRNKEVVDLVRARPDLTYREIALHYGISGKRVHQIVKRAGITRPTPTPSADEIKIAASKVRKGIPIKYVAEIVGYSEDILRGALVRHGLYALQPREPLWTDSEIRIVKRHYHRLPVREIAAKIGRTRNEIIGKARRLGLCRPLAA